MIIVAAWLFRIPSGTGAIKLAALAIAHVTPKDELLWQEGVSLVKEHSCHSGLVKEVTRAQRRVRLWFLLLLWTILAHALP